VPKPDTQPNTPEPKLKRKDQETQIKTQIPHFKKEEHKGFGDCGKSMSQWTIQNQLF